MHRSAWQLCSCIVIDQPPKRLSSDAQRKARKGQAPGSGYADSIESLVRNKIQKIKIDMANEVIDAGRFDMQTSMAERKETLESMLQVSACGLGV